MRHTRLLLVLLGVLFAAAAVAAAVVPETADENATVDNATVTNSTAAAEEEAEEVQKKKWSLLSTAFWTLLGVAVFFAFAVKNAWDARSNRCVGVRCAPQQFIRVTKTALAQAIVDKYSNPEQRRKVQRILDLLDAAFDRKYAMVQEQMLADYDAFDPVAARTTSSVAGGAGEDGTGGDEYVVRRRQQQETRFLAAVQHMLIKAGFAPLTQSVADFALAEDYMLTMPVDVNWDAFDSRMLCYHRLHSATAAINAGLDALRQPGTPPRRSTAAAAAEQPKEEEELFEHKDEVMVYHRGITLDVTHGRLISQKIDALVSTAMTWVFGSVRKLVDMLPFLPARQPLPELLDLSGGAPEDACTVVKRVRLQSKVLNPANFLLESTVQEPAFEEVFVLWRPRPDSETVAQMAMSGLATQNADRSHFIFARCMRGVPLADLELVFPEKHIHMKPKDLITMVSGVCTALVALVSQLLSRKPSTTDSSADSSSSSGGMAGVVLTAAVATVMKAMSAYTQSLSEYNNVVQAGLNARTLGNTTSSSNNNN